jgi:mannose-6-phosphate isomerase-like protein (cupin superfamily)
MADNTIDLTKNYLLLEPDGAAVVLPGGGDFWSQLMSANATDPGIRRLMGSEHGRLLSASTMRADWTNWEMHPAGDEILFMLEGKATFVLKLSGGLSEVALSAGQSLVIPKGVWHTAKLTEPARRVPVVAAARAQDLQITAKFPMPRHSVAVIGRRRRVLVELARFMVPAVVSPSVQPHSAV